MRPRARPTILRLAVALTVLLGTTGCWTDEGNTQAQARDVAEPAEPQIRTGPNVRYVSPDGRDDGRGTKREPWRTLRHALREVFAGQVLYVRGGNYHEDLRSFRVHPGDRDAPILVQAYPGERPVVHGPVWLRQPSHWSIDGLNVTWDDSVVDPPRHMVKVTGGVAWTWQNSEIWGAVGLSNVLINGLGEEEPSDWSFVGNCVHGLTLPEGVKRGSNMTVGDMKAGGPGTIERNLFFDNENGRNLTFGYLRADDSGGPTNVEVRLNTLYNSNSAIRLAGDTTGIRIERNILGNASSGILIRAKRLLGADVKIQQNLGVGAQQFLLDGQTGELSPNRAGNNLVDSIDFDDETSCEGFNSDDGIVLPYGRDGIG